MPLHEYRCPKCGHRFEILWRNWDTIDDPFCQKCGKHSIRVFSTFNYSMPKDLEWLEKAERDPKERRT